MLVVQFATGGLKKLNPSVSIIGYMTDEGKTLITRAGNKHALVEQGWNHLKK